MKNKAVLRTLVIAALAATSFATSGYGDVRRVQFKLKGGSHGKYNAYLYEPGSSQPIRRVTDITVAGGIYVTFDYTGTNRNYYIKAEAQQDTAYNASSGTFKLDGNWPGWYDSKYYVGEITVP